MERRKFVQTGLAGIAGLPAATAVAAGFDPNYVMPSEQAECSCSTMPCGISVADFGAIGNGLADDTAAIQSAINSIPAGGRGTVYFPPGTYVCSAALTIGGRSVEIVGCSRATNLKFVNATHGLDIDTQQPATFYIAPYVFSVRHITITTTALTIGHAIHAHGSGGMQAGNPTPMLMIDDVYIQGYDGFNNEWNTGVYIANTINSVLTRMTILGRYNTTNATGVYVTDHSTHVTLDNCRVFYFNTGILAESVNAMTGGSEGLLISNCLILSVNVGIKRNHIGADASPHVAITNTHVNARQCCIQCYNGYEFFIVGNVLYLQQVNGQAIANPCFGISIEAGDNRSISKRSTIVGNVINVLDIDPNKNCIGIRCALEYTTVVGNVFTALRTGIQLETGNFVAGGNLYENCANQIYSIAAYPNTRKLSSVAIPVGGSNE